MNKKLFLYITLLASALTSDAYGETVSNFIIYNNTSDATITIGNEGADNLIIAPHSRNSQFVEVIGNKLTIHMPRKASVMYPIAGSDYSVTLNHRPENPDLPNRPQYLVTFVDLLNTEVIADQTITLNPPENAPEAAPAE